MHCEDTASNLLAPVRRYPVGALAFRRNNHSDRRDATSPEGVRRPAWVSLSGCSIPTKSPPGSRLLPRLLNSYADGVRGFTLLCECGEETHQAMSGFEQVEVECICGRLWVVNLTATKNVKWVRPACRSPCSQFTSSYCSGHRRYGHRFVVVQRARALAVVTARFATMMNCSDARAKFVAVIVTRASRGGRTGATSIVVACGAWMRSCQ